MVKGLFVLEIFKFLYWLFGYVGKCFVKKAKFSLFQNSQTGLKIITTQILLNIWRCKDSQTMKLGQLIKYNMSNIFNKNYLED